MNKQKKLNVKELLDQAFSDVSEEDIQRFFELWLLLPATTFIIVRTLLQQDFWPELYTWIWIFLPTIVTILFRFLIENKTWKLLFKMLLLALMIFIFIVCGIYLYYKLGFPNAEKWMERMVMFFTI